MKTHNILTTRNGIAIAILQLGMGLSGSLFFPFIEPLLYDLGASFTLITFRRTFVAFASLFVAWIWGGLADFFQSYKKLIAFSFSLAISFCLPFLFFPRLTKNAFFLMLSLAFFSIFRSMVFPVRNAFITLISEEEKGGETIGYLYVFSSVGWGIGSLVFGRLIDHGEIVSAFLITAFFSFLTLFMFYFLFEDTTLDVEGKIDLEEKSFFELLTEVKTVLAIFAVAIFILGISRNIFFTFFKIKLYIAYQKSYTILGIITTLAGFGGALAAIFYGKMVDKFGGAIILAIGSLIYMGFYLLLAFSFNPYLITIPWIVPVGSLISIPAVSLTGKLSNERERGRSQGIISGAQRIAGIGTVFGGLVADFIGATESIHKLTYIFLGLTPFPLITVLILYFLVLKKA